MIRNSKLGGTDWTYGETPLKSEDLNDTFDAVGMGLKKATMELDTNSYVLGTNNPTYKFTLPNSNNIITHIHVIYNREDNLDIVTTDLHPRVMVSDFIKINGLNISMPETVSAYTGTRQMTIWGALLGQKYQTQTTIHNYSIDRLFPITKEVITEASVSSSSIDRAMAINIPTRILNIPSSDEYTITIDKRVMLTESPSGGSGGSERLNNIITLTNIQISIYYIENIDNEINSNKFSIVT